jgi:hypothetical protein
VLRFSVTNDSSTRIQIANIHVFKVASLKDDHGAMHYLMGPRVKLEFNLKTVAEGDGVGLLRGQVSNLQPGEAEAFEIKLDTENAVSLIDFEAEYIVASAKIPLTARPRDVILIHAPTEVDRGQIISVNRKTLFDSMLSETRLALWGASSYRSCGTHGLAMLRGAATLGLDDPEKSWNLVRNKFEGSETFGFILASYADGLDQGLTPASAKAYLAGSVSDPKKLRQLTVTDDEVVSVTISRALQKIDGTPGPKTRSHISSPSEYEISPLDRLLEVSPVIDTPDDDEDDSKLSNARISETLGLASSQVMRADLLRTVSRERGVTASEFLIATLVVQPQLHHEIDLILCDLFSKPKPSFTLDEDEVVKKWWSWWRQNELDPENETVG